MIIIIGHLDVEPGARDTLVTSSAELQASTRSDEPGCLSYTITSDPVDPGRVSITEIWESEEALDDHFTHPNFFAMGELFRSVPRHGGSAVKYRVGEHAPVRDEAGNPSATYWPDAP